MADWFETRFREPVGTEQLDPAFVARMRALVVEEWQADAGTIPPAGTDADAEPDPDLREGDVIMLQTEDRPTGHDPVTPHRRSPGRWLLVAAAAAVVALVGTLLVAAGGDDDDPLDTVQPTPTTEPVQDILDLPGISDGFPDLEPGRYAMDPDGDDTTPLRVTYDIAAEGWSGWFGALKFSDSGLTMLSIATVENLTSDACLDPTPLDPPVGPTVDDLATALTRLAPFTVTAPPTDVTFGGYSGKHLELTVPGSGLAGCVDGKLHSWIAPVNGGPFAGYDEPGQTEEYWILDVEGTRLVLVQLDSPDTPAQDIAERDAIFDSISIEP
jgi:hypothetical protein